MLSYSQFLNTDKDLSFRQVYWDLSHTFNVNPQLSSQFSATGQGLNLLFNQSSLLVSSIKDKTTNYQPGVFLTDPYFMSTLTTLTKDANLAAGLGATAELVTAFIAARKKKNAFKNDFPKMAEMSALMVYPEIDINLSQNLIDACVTSLPYHMISPIYRYDFDNGASLRVENGILTFFNPTERIIKPLMFAEERLGNIYQKKLSKPTSPYKLDASVIIVDEKSGNYYLKTGRNVEDEKCKNCLEKKQDYLLSTTNSEITKIEYVYYNVQHNRHQGLMFHNDTVTTIGRVSTSDGEFTVYSIKKGKISGSSRFNIPNDFKFKVRNQTKKFGGGTGDEMLDLTYLKDKKAVSLVCKSMDLLSEYIFRNETDSTVYTSSVFYAGSGKKEVNLDEMTNYLTGLTLSKTGDLYFTLGDNLHIEGSVRPQDVHAWIGSENRLILAKSHQEQFDLKTYTLSGPITKIRVKENFTWALAGNDLYRIDNEGTLVKYYTINNLFPTFAAGIDNIYTNDGYKISTRDGAKSLFLSGNAVPDMKNLQSELGEKLPGFLMEFVELEKRLYFLDADDGLLYWIDNI